MSISGTSILETSGVYGGLMLCNVYGGSNAGKCMIATLLFKIIYRWSKLSIAQYYISLYLGWEVYIDDQYRNPNMNNKDYLFGRLTTFYVSLDAFMLILISMSSTKPGESVGWSVCNTFRWGCKLALYQHPQGVSISKTRFMH